MASFVIFLFDITVDNLTPNQQNSKKEASVKAQVLSLAWELGYLIAVPLVVFALGGRFLDQKLDSAPICLLAGIVLAVIVTTLGVYWKMSKINI